MSTKVVKRGGEQRGREEPDRREKRRKRAYKTAYSIIEGGEEEKRS